AFEQANRNSVVTELADVQSDHEAKPKNSAELDEPETPIAPKVAPLKKKPEKIKATKPKKGGRLLGGLALSVSVIGVALAAFAILSQKDIRLAADQSMNRIDAAIGDLVSQTDGIVADMAGVQSDVQANTVRIDDIGGLRRDLQTVATALTAVRTELDAVKETVDRHGVAIEETRKGITELRGQVKQLNSQPAVDRKSTR